MAEYGPGAMWAMYGIVGKTEPSLRRSGIVGDAAHTFGYHRSRNALLRAGRRGDYSLQAPADKRGDGDACAGIDLSFNPAGMARVTRRLMDACKPKSDGSYDPRIEPVREFFGTLDGRRVTGWNRYPSSNRQVGYTTSDSSHLWHVHVSLFRAYVNDEAAMRGVAEVMAGITPKPVPKPTIITNEKDDELPTPRDVFNTDNTISNDDGFWADKANKGIAAATALRVLKREITELQASVEKLTAAVEGLKPEQPQ